MHPWKRRIQWQGKELLTNQQITVASVQCSRPTHKKNVGKRKSRKKKEWIARLNADQATRIKEKRILNDTGTGRKRVRSLP